MYSIPNSWPVNPLPPKPLPSNVRTYHDLLCDKYPEFFGPTADHFCLYREHLFDMIVDDMQDASLQKVAGMLSIVIFVLIL